MGQQIHRGRQTAAHHGDTVVFVGTALVQSRSPVQHVSDPVTAVDHESERAA